MSVVSTDVLVVIPYYSGKQSLSELLLELKAFQVSIVNNSGDPLEISSNKNHSVLNLMMNTGFSHACTVGSLQQSSKWVLFLNPDLHISAPSISALLTEANSKSLHAISPRLVHKTGMVDINYHQELPTFLSLLVQFSPLQKTRTFSKHIGNGSHTTLPGACLLIRRDALEKIGHWDERFFLWWEDSDVSKKLSLYQLKYEVSQEITATHKGGESFEKLPEQWKRRVFFQSLLQYSKKYFNALQHTLLRTWLLRFTTNKLYPVDESITLSVIVPNVKKHLLESFLKKNYTFLNEPDIELIIVTSTDDIRDLRREYPNVLFITLEKNEGFAPTVNIGLQRARGNHLCTINDDVLLHKDWYVPLLAKVTVTTGTVSPKVVNASGLTESIGVHILKKGRALALTECTSKSYTINAFNAACVIFSRSALEKSGLFNESFESYLEDLDLGLRMFKDGFTHTAVSEVTVQHHGQQTSNDNLVKKSWQDTRNWWLLILYNYSAFDWLRYFLPIMIERLRNISGLIRVVFAQSKN